MNAHSKTGNGTEVEQEFDAARYLRYVAGHWRMIAAACGVALLITFAVSISMTKRYTSTASILIEPPAGSDPRTLTAVSPVYLESLKSYELFAGSDSLFQRTVEKFGLAREYAGVPLESLKSRVLKVSKVRDTKLLQISVTLPDPKQAQAIAQFIAEETVRLSASINGEANLDLIASAQRQLDAATSQLKEAQEGLSQYGSREPIESLRLELDSLTELRMSVQRDLLESEARLAEATVDRRDDDVALVPSLKARVELLAKQLEHVRQRIESASKLLEKRAAGREALDMASQSAHSAFEAASNRLREARASSAYAGERLKVVDPGIVAQRPTSPKVALNCVVAVVFALAGALAYLTVRFTTFG